MSSTFRPLADAEQYQAKLLTVLEEQKECECRYWACEFASIGRLENNGHHPNCPHNPAISEVNKAWNDLMSTQVGFDGTYPLPDGDRVAGWKNPPPPGTGGEP